MARKSKPAVEAKDLSDEKLQSFVMQKMSRADLRGAAYNPRITTDAEKRKLRSGLKKHGLVAPITWNKRTGSLVAGHQRISQLDSLMGTTNYRLDVAVIDVDEKQEKEINILLNNQEAQGSFDMEKLAAIINDKSLSIEGMGFDQADVFRMFGDSVLDQAETAQLEEFAKKVRDARDLYDAMSKKGGNRDTDNFFIVIVFRSEQERTAFTEKHGLPDNRYQSGDDIARVLASVTEKEPA
jgi:hypothetical protein